MRTVYDNKQLIATEGMQRLVNANSQYIKILTDGRWNLLGDFTFSIIVKPEAFPGSYNMILDGTGNTFRLYTSASGAGTVTFQSSSSSDSCFLNPAAPQALVIGPSRITISRIGSTLYYYYNSRILATDTYTGTITMYTNPGDFINVGTQSGAIDFFDGFIGQILLVNGKGMTAAEVSEWHNSNVPPVSTHPYVVAHYRMNETINGAMIDSVEDYNYAKSVYANDDTLATGQFPDFGTPSSSWSKTTGTDGDGDYVEFELTAAASPGGNVMANFSTSFAYSDRYSTMRTRFKIVSGQMFQDSYFIGISNRIYYSAGVDGTSLIYLERSGFPTVTLTFFGMYDNTTSASAAMGDKFRVYFLEMTTVLNANHGELMNYTSDELGVTNGALKSTDVGFYDGNVSTDKILQLNGVDQCIIKTTSITLPQWTIFLDCITTSNSEYFFINKETDSATNLLLIRNTPDGLRIYAGAYDTILTSYIGVRMKLCVRCDGPYTYITVSYSNGVTLTSSIGASINYFDRFEFGAARQYSIYYPSKLIKFAGVSRYISNHEVKKLLNHTTSSEYLSIPDLFVHYDFGSLYEDSGDFYVRDLTGGGLDALFDGFSVIDNQPLEINQSTDLPDRKALMFNGTNQRIDIANFSPTKEKGYTWVIGFALNTNRAFNATNADVFFVKRGSGGGARIVYGEEGGDSFKLYDSEFSVSTVSASINGDTSRINYGATTYKYNAAANRNTATMILNGVQRTLFAEGSYDVYGFDELNGMFTIGQDPAATSRVLHGYLCHLSIYKGVLTPAEIASVIHLNKPPIRIWSDCQLYLNFERIKQDILFDEDAPALTSSDMVKFGPNVDFVVSTGTDGDGDYIQFELGSDTTNGLLWVLLGGSFGSYWKVATTDFRIKLVAGKMFLAGFSNGGAGRQYLDAAVAGTSIMTITPVAQMSTAYGPEVGFCDGVATPTAGSTFRLYGITVTEIPNIPDWSPQNRFAGMYNYSADEVDPGHIDYRIEEISTIMGL